MSKTSQRTPKVTTEVQDQIEIDLRKFILIISRYWAPSLIAFSVIVLPIGIFALTRKANYRAVGSVLIKKDVPSSAVLGLKVDVGEIDSLDRTGPLTTQAEIVKSLPIVQRTIDELDLRDKEGLPLKSDVFLKNLKVAPVPRSDLLSVEYRSEDPQLAAEVVNHLVKLYLDTNLQTNRAEVKAAREFIQTQLPIVERNVRRAEQDIRRFKENNQIVALQEEERSSVAVTAELEKRISEIRAKLLGATARANELRQQVGRDVNAASTQVALSQSTGVQETLKRYQDLQNQLAALQGRYRDDHPKVAEMQRQVDELGELLKGRIFEVTGQAASSRPDVGSLQLGGFRQQLVTELVMAQLEQLNLAQQEESLNASLAAHEQRASALPKFATAEAELGRRLKAAQATYETLLSKLQEVQVAEQQQLGNASILSKAIPPEKPLLLTSNLGKLLLISAGGIVGLIVGGTVAILAYLLDRRIRSVQDLKDIFDSPILGIIPLFQDAGLSQMVESLTRSFQKHGSTPTGFDTELVVRDVPRSPATAAYQMLRTNLKFISSDRQARAFVVTSCIAGEGKSTVSANLALAYAQQGQRVLLIDADLRRPRQHEVWSIDSYNKVGLSNLLVGITSLEDAVRPVMENLYLLPAGKIPPNPVTLLDSERMAHLVQDFLGKFDCVIFDTPPLSGIADALILGKMTDGIVLVSRMGTVNFSSAQNAKEYLGQAEQKVLGIVINGVNPKDEPDSYFYGAYYYYGYGVSSTSNGAIDPEFSQPRSRR
ncbi:polysaccharide biosynthesis tyrosine autokinase [Leptolyngbya boryana CZ1]|uniref:non-specific protein-tyrosine kinase n=1 Tax=Leptolyngbya boryana CZ1 TaxID=3060204 RepID=A0AA96WY11_LEPBY|nr:polysaccharide biosynthesis tyrosine autokinase [Leptolyngbya boryana]WNZ47622.1 polysaccharide biosynthesis tyrosine autokinase [Leptolyngbya boryana CZ1]